MLSCSFAWKTVPVEEMLFRTTILPISYTKMGPYSIQIKNDILKVNITIKIIIYDYKHIPMFVVIYDCHQNLNPIVAKTKAFSEVMFLESGQRTPY